jgi:hypothetical protein
MSRANSFHVDYFGPIECWPQGGWSVYQITGDEIADRVVREKIDPRGFYTGKVTHRHSWCGYIGTFTTLADAMAAIEQHTDKVLP